MHTPRKCISSWQISDFRFSSELSLLFQNDVINDDGSLIYKWKKKEILYI